MEDKWRRVGQTAREEDKAVLLLLSSQCGRARFFGGIFLDAGDKVGPNRGRAKHKKGKKSKKDLVPSLALHFREKQVSGGLKEAD